VGRREIPSFSMELMNRKVREEIRRRLKQAAKARWARHRAEKKSSGSSAGAAIPSTIKTVAANSVEVTTSRPVIVKLDLRALERGAGVKISTQGRALLREKYRFRLENLSEISAVVRIQEAETRRVRFVLVDDGVSAFCGCIYEGGVAEVICKHKFAAALFLKEKAPASVRTVSTNALPTKPKPFAKKISADPSPKQTPAKPAASNWQAELAHLLQGDPIYSRRVKTEALLFFSFIRRNQQYVVQPGLIEANIAPRHLWEDRKALGEFLVEFQALPAYRSAERPIRSQDINHYQWVNARPGHQVLLQTTLGRLQNPYHSYYNQNSPHWEQFSDALTFLGDEDQLIRESIEICPDQARIKMMMERENGGLRLSLAAALPDRSIRINSPELTSFCASPVWLREGRRIFQVEISDWRFSQLSGKPDVFVPREAIPEFYRRNYGDIVAAYDLSAEGELVAQPVVGKTPTPRAYLTEEDGELRAQLRFAYDNLECIAAKNPPSHSYAFDAEQDIAGKIERSCDAETEWLDRLGQEEFGLKPGARLNGTTPDIFLLRKSVHPFDFLKNYIPKLTAAGVEIFGESDLKMGRINRAKAVISFDVTSGMDWFDVKAVVHFDDLEVSLAEIKRSLRKNLRFIKLADGSVGEIPPEWLEKYKHLFGLSETIEDGFRLARHHVALLDQLVTDKEQVKTDRQFKKASAWLKNFDGIQSQTLPTGFQGKLRPYQKAGLDWFHFLRESRFGGCLADDMGIGKTIQALCYLQSLKEAYEARNLRKRKKEPRAAHLLVMPRTLISNWEREAQKFTPGLKLLNFSTAERVADVKEFDQYDVVLTTYGVLLREIERVKEYEFDTVILDEAQAIKNPLSESSKAARLINARHRVTLTGTPIENNTFELWSQFAFLNPGLLGSADYFREGFSGPIERQSDEQAVKTLRRLVYPFILRRTKDQVELDLPPRTEKILWNEMGTDQRKLYNLTRDEYRAKILKLIEDNGVKDARFRILEGLLRLRQICNHPCLVNPGYKGESAKLDVLLDTISTLNKEGHKVLVFSQFVQMLRLIETGLKKERIPYAYLDGSTVNRQSCVDAFQKDEHLRAFLISLKAGGVGLNLTAADYVIHVDPWWNPAVEMQASDRAHRIGQTKPVFVYKLMMRDSVEEKILKLQDRKRSLVKQLITTETGFFKSLTADDIAALFS
jgi:non-specific serine/threonine protein kinase